VNALISESLERAKNRLKPAKKKITANENKNTKKTYNTASAFTTIMKKVLGKMDVFENDEEMNDDILDKINTTTVEYAKGCSKKNTDGSDGENSNNESPKPPSKKRHETDTSSLFKNTDEDSDNDNDKVFAVNDDDEDDENEGDRDAKED
jgi:hypothetical protein